VEEEPSPDAPPPNQQGGSALFRDANGKPLFPLLHKWRLESKEMLQQQTAVGEQWKKDIISKQWKAASEVKKQLDEAVVSSSKQLQSVFSGTRSAAQTYKPGSHVRTPFGTGTIRSIRPSVDEKETTIVCCYYEIDLCFGAVLYTSNTRDLTILPKKKKKKMSSTMELNAAFEVSEEHRVQKLKADCARLGIPYDDETCSKTCLTCLVAPPKPAPAVTPAAAFADPDGNPRFPRLYGWRQKSTALLESSKQAVVQNKRPPQPCILCGSMACRAHSSVAFAKEGIVVCEHCLQDLEYDYTASTETITPEQLGTRAARLGELYARAVLLLQYSSPFLLPCADQLQANTVTRNEIAVKSSSAGLVSGVLGVAAACTVFTPAGPPLLVATLVFGGSATAVQTGSEAIQYYSEPNQLANRVLALSGMVQNMLIKVQLMRESTLVPYLDRAVLNLQPEEETGGSSATSNNKSPQPLAALAGTCMGSTAATGVAMAGVQESVVVGRFASRATTAAARTARFARFAGGALSAATLVLEARELQHTLDQIAQGHPCDKAAQLRAIHGGLNELPSATVVQRVGQTFAKVRAREVFRMAVTGTDLSDEGPPVVDVPASAVDNVKQVEEEMQLVEEVVSSLEATEQQQDNGDSSSQSTTSTKSRSPQQLSSKSTLLERVRRYKERQAAEQAVDALPATAATEAEERQYALDLNVCELFA